MGALPMIPYPEREIRKIAKRSDHRWAHHVAILYLAGEIVAIGFNKGEMHAEEMALLKLRMARGRASVLRSIRIRRDGRLGASQPCEECFKRIQESGIRQVYYSDYDGSEKRMVI
jgi:pyrimidine deaminase RibD-like protein